MRLLATWAIACVIVVPTILVCDRHWWHQGWTVRGAAVLAAISLAVSVARRLLERPSGRASGGGNSGEDRSAAAH